MDYYLMIDGGTTNTRFTLWEGDEKVAFLQKKVGASNARNSNENERLENVVKATIIEMEREYNCKINKVIASGMITSNVGLYEVEHLNAPVTFNELISSIKACKLTNISDSIDFFFVPGIKFGNDITNLCEKDMLRGEETEIFGNISENELYTDKLYIHFGSHNKILLYKNGAIAKSITSLGGELLWAIANSTILKSSITDLDPENLDEEAVLKGYTCCDKHGLSRTLFLARICNIMEGKSNDFIVSYIYGALAFSDITAFSDLLFEDVSEIVLYGRAPFAIAFKVCIKQYPELYKKIKHLDYESSENLSIEGLRKIYSKLKKAGFSNDR